MTKNNVLYFEGAGMNFYSEEQTNYSDVGNFRIRTAFKNLDGTSFYIELGNCPRFENKGKKMKVVTDFALRIEHLFKLEDRFKEELEMGGYEMKKNHLEIRKLDYTKSSITKWINENLNCNFDTIQVLNEFYGYRVHGDGAYNLMEDIELNHDRAAAREQAYNNVDMEYRNFLNAKYSKISLLDMDDESISIRCYASDSELKDKPRHLKVPVNY